ncbi:MAG: helix-turn-helix transcriptional regulator [Asticcacaulis sp.]|nr:helix-turn-helix transcriptional regulator [Asticcacaulis sp.]
MIERLTEKPMSVSALAAPYDMTLTAVGQHLTILEVAGLVTTEKQGRVRVCKADTRGLDVLKQWLSDRRPPAERMLDRLGNILDES